MIPFKVTTLRNVKFFTTWFFKYRLKFQDFVCNGCHDLSMLYLNISDIAIITVKGIDYCCIVYGTSKSEAIHLLQSFVLDDVGIYKK